MKTCNRCGESKPLSEFHCQQTAPDGRYYSCKSCVALRSEAYRRKVIGRPSAVANELLQSARRRAKDSGLVCTITSTWITIRIERGFCLATGIRFDLHPTYEGRGTRTPARPFRPSLDRIDPTQGYTRENCQVVVWIYNAAKQEFTHEDVLAMARALVEKNP